MDKGTGWRHTERYGKKKHAGGQENPETTGPKINTREWIEKCVTEAVVMGWGPEKCGACAYWPECQKLDGVCPELQRMPTPRWTADFTAAVDVYFKAISMSGRDFNGMPQLNMLEFVMGHEDMVIEDKGLFFTYIRELHRAMIETARGK